MLTRIKKQAARGASALFSITLFIFMLPLTIGMMLLVLLLGIAAKATLSNRLRSSKAEGIGFYSQARKNMNMSNKKPPIEGSYTVIDK